MEIGMKRASEHHHEWQQVGLTVQLDCACGIVLCGSVQLGKELAPACNLAVGHSGSCMCSWHPEWGTWEKQGVSQQLVAELVEV